MSSGGLVDVVQGSNIKLVKDIIDPITKGVGYL